MARISLIKRVFSTTEVDIEDHTPDVSINGGEITITYEIDESALDWDDEESEIEVA